MGYCCDRLCAFVQNEDTAIGLGKELNILSRSEWAILVGAWDPGLSGAIIIRKAWCRDFRGEKLRVWINGFDRNVKTS